MIERLFLLFSNYVNIYKNLKRLRFFFLKWARVENTQKHFHIVGMSILLHWQPTTDMCTMCKLHFIAPVRAYRLLIPDIYVYIVYRSVICFKWMREKKNKKKKCIYRFKRLLLLLFSFSFMSYTFWVLWNHLQHKRICAKRTCVHTRELWFRSKKSEINIYSENVKNN